MSKEAAEDSQPESVESADEFFLDGGDLMPALEAILMVAAEPVRATELASVMGMAPEEIETALTALQAEYDGKDLDGQLIGRERGFELRRIDGGWRIFSRPKWAPWVGAFVAGTGTAQLTRAALETLAIIAYRQPVTRAQIARIRGVNVDSVLRTLLARDLIEESGTSITGAHLFRTTGTFLERMGLASIEELVPLAPFVPGPESAEELSAELEG